jgi:hypothetical protein
VDSLAFGLVITAGASRLRIIQIAIQKLPAFISLLPRVSGAYQLQIHGYIKVALVTGSSSEIRLEISLLLARNGFKTFATMVNIDRRNETSMTSTIVTIGPIISHTCLNS